MKLKLIDISRTKNLQTKETSTEEYTLVSAFADRPIINLDIYRLMLCKKSAPTSRLTNLVR